MSKILFITQNARAGHSYVSQAFADALKDDHEVKILATQGVKEQYPFWKDYDPILVDVPYFNLREKWEEIEPHIKDADVVFFNEWRDHQFVQMCKQHAKVVTYIDWFRKEWIPMYEQLWDMTISCAEHTYDVFQPQKNARFVPWGVDLAQFKPEKGEQLFFHNAGWGGINGRKGTKEFMEAYDNLAEKHKITGLLHTQKPVFENTTIEKVKRHREKGLKVKMGSVKQPGLYHKAKVFVAPTKLEGLGLSIPEALASGLPVITTNASPMKQFVKDGYNGLLVDVVKDRFLDGGTTKTVVRKKYREDGYYFPEYTIDQKDLEKKMEYFIKNPKKVEEMGKNARKFMEENHSFEKHFKPKVLELIKEL